MKIRLTAPHLRPATINLPSSKSISNRLLILQALSDSPYPIERIADCDDTRVMREALNSNTNVFDIGAAGTAMRFLTAFLSRIMGEWTLTGSARMQERPIAPLVDALRATGAHIEYLNKEGYPPLRIQGSLLVGGEISLPGDISSQYISALLMVAPRMLKGLNIRLEGAVISRPYIQMTLALMRQFGVDSSWEGETIHILPQSYTPRSISVEPDWSAASYWYVVAALAPHVAIHLTALQSSDLQGDAVVATIMQQLGVESVFTSKGVIVKGKGCSQDPWEFDFTDHPDLAQGLVVASVMLNKPFYFRGLQSLKIKETDRIVALQTELKKWGYPLTIHHDNALQWGGERCEATQDATIETYHDHRMAMAFAPAALLRPVVINDPEVVTKSYPHFWEDLQKAGFEITEL